MERHALSANKWACIKYVAEVKEGFGGTSIIKRKEFDSEGDSRTLRHNCLLWHAQELCCPRHKRTEEVKMLAGTEKERLKQCDCGWCRCPP